MAIYSKTCPATCSRFCRIGSYINTKINKIGCKTNYMTQIAIFMTPHRPPLSELFRFVLFCFFGQHCMSHFLANFNKKRCQNAQETILHQIRYALTEFETSHILNPCIAHHYYLIIYWQCFSSSEPCGASSCL